MTVQTAKTPGAALHQILSELDIHPTKDCPCFERMLLMDEWGVEECKQNFDVIVGWLRTEHVKWHWRAKLKASLMSLNTNLPFVCNPFDPFPGLVLEAIRRSE